MASTPAVLVGMPVSTDEVRTDLAVVQGAVVQGTPLTRQLSQSAISEASVNGVAETEGERERETHGGVHGGVGEEGGGGN